MKALLISFLFVATPLVGFTAEADGPQLRAEISLAALPADIRTDLSAISPEHINVFTDIVAEIESSITRLLQ